ncbi:MAG: iron ABC transporter substrate-binding protein, partial [Butyrivibrio sp.]|nr:iron ABC transporter substrate-binding protein [Butyrivibrio sp.]
MKKRLALVLAGLMTLGLIGCGEAESSAPAAAETPAATEAPAAEAPAAEAESSGMDALIEAAKAEGELIVYGSCEEEYLAAACENFEKLYGIKVQYQRLSTGEVQSKIEEENGNPSGDVWFG